VEIEGRIMDALSKARIPVTLVDWYYVPEYDEWQLIVATPWHDRKGPLETYGRVIEALQQAGVYKDSPIRRLSLRSPEDSLVKTLEKKARGQTEGNIHLIESRGAGREKAYSVIFAPFVGPGGPLPAKRISGLEQLREFLENQLLIRRSAVDEAVTDLTRKRNASISGVQLTARTAKKFGLG
jgi:hypothetical protein